MRRSAPPASAGARAGEGRGASRGPPAAGPEGRAQSGGDSAGAAGGGAAAPRPEEGGGRGRGRRGAGRGAPSRPPLHPGERAGAASLRQPPPWPGWCRTGRDRRLRGSLQARGQAADAGASPRGRTAGSPSDPPVLANRSAVPPTHPRQSSRGRGHCLGARDHPGTLQRATREAAPGHRSRDLAWVVQGCRSNRRSVRPSRCLRATSGSPAAWAWLAGDFPEVLNNEGRGAFGVPAGRRTMGLT